MDKFKMDETSSCTHALPMCAVWDHIGEHFYAFSFEIYKKDCYGNVDFDDTAGGHIKMSELEELGRNKLPEKHKDMKLYDMHFKHHDSCLFVTVIFGENDLGL